MQKKNKTTLTLKDGVQKYIVYQKASGRSVKTIKASTYRLSTLVEYMKSRLRIKLQDVQDDDMDYYIVSNSDRGLSTATIAGLIQVSKTFFKWCVERGYIRRSPALHLKKPKLDLSAKNKAISQFDLESMINYTRSNNMLMEEALLMFLADTGCRSGELCSVNVSSVKFNTMEAHIRGKTGAGELYFTEPTAGALKRWIAHKERVVNNNDALFVGKGGKRITPDGVYGRLRKIGLCVGAKRYNPHAFRHRVGQGWIDQGANLELVRLKLRHSDISTTSQYYANQDYSREKIATLKYSLVAGV